MDGSGEVGLEKDKTEEGETETEVVEVSSCVDGDADEEEAAERRRLIGEEGVSGQDSEEVTETRSEAGVEEVLDKAEDC